MKKIETYWIDFQNKKVIVMQDYADRAGSKVDSDENKEFTALLEKYNNYDFVFKKGVSPSKNTHSGLTYKRIETFITRFDPTAIKKLREETSYYKTITPKWNSKVRSWFIREYPEYQEVEDKNDIADLKRLDVIREEKANAEQSAKILTFDETAAAS